MMAKVISWAKRHKLLTGIVIFIMFATILEILDSMHIVSSWGVWQLIGMLAIPAFILYKVLNKRSKAK